MIESVSWTSVGDPVVVLTYFLHAHASMSDVNCVVGAVQEIRNGAGAAGKVKK